jgi:hypothetical protein
MEPLQVMRESESQASRVMTLAPRSSQLVDPVPDGRDAAPRFAAMTSARTAATAVALTTLGLAART